MLKLSIFEAIKDTTGKKKNVVHDDVATNVARVC